MITIEYKLLEDEVILDDNYTLYKGYVYIVDGVFKRCRNSKTVGYFKTKFGVKEVRKCILIGHEFARLGDTVS